MSSLGFLRLLSDATPCDETKIDEGLKPQLVPTKMREYNAPLSVANACRPHQLVHEDIVRLAQMRPTRFGTRAPLR
jgi:hypothetical protein